MWRANAFVVWRHAWRQQKRLKYFTCSSAASPFHLFDFLCLAGSLNLSRKIDAWMLDSHWKSPLLCVSFLSPLVRWWTLWSRTPLHVALSCTTSLSRSLPLWRTTSMSAAVKPEPANIFCSQSLPPAANCLSPTYVVTWECRSQELSVLSVIILQANCYQDGKRQSKGFKPAC